MARAKLKVGLLWHSASSGNLGVAALTVANMAIAKQAAKDVGVECEFVILGMRDGICSYVRPEEAEVFILNTRSLLGPGGFLREVGRLDCVLDIGGGDSFTDIYSDLRYAYISLTKGMTHLRGVPLLLSPQTIGPFTKPLHTAFARWSLKRSHPVVARDIPSYELARKLAPRAKVVQSTDVAFALPFDDRGRERNGAKLRVGVNVSGLLSSWDEQGQNHFGLSFHYGDLTRRFLAELSRRPDVEIHLITHATADYHKDDDGWAVDQMAQEFPDAIRVPDFAGPSEAKSYISSLDFLTAARMHACIGAFSALTPVVPVAYSRKFRGVFGQLNYPWYVDTQGRDTDQALAFLLDCLDRRHELGAAAAKGMQQVEPLLSAYSAELRALFSDVAAKAA
ncbi:MAG: polysaccharide pyruvyl transferase family protein [Phenylobacterium sp.]|uniref:polysaccharide pyruvyl transferase family protein n=1 Tax=Phenylobacterium sp. TaxID=1871053 RepID=UPI001A646A71|nr:polysaccharide pyruvyl transferase family protein [Phenylobacterium sp.]MBL8770977.1 polysaccharide pyruvyl transferase family protein [Phenylobacterium sp.]